jgi:hypothetical protein
MQLIIITWQHCLNFWGDIDRCCGVTLSHLVNVCCMHFNAVSQRYHNRTVPYWVLYVSRLLWHQLGMPRSYKRIPGSRNYAAYTPAKLNAALEAISKGLTQRQASVKFGIPRSTLKNKVAGKHGKKFGGQTALTEQEETTFSKYCISMSTFGFPLDTWDLRCVVKSYLDRQGRVMKQFKNNLPGSEWTMSFLKRHPELSIRFASNIKRKRAQISTDTINEYFTNLASELDGVPPSFHYDTKWS